MTISYINGNACIADDVDELKITTHEIASKEISTRDIIPIWISINVK